MGRDGTGQGVSLRDDENVLKLIVLIDTPLCEYG